MAMDGMTFQVDGTYQFSYTPGQYGVHQNSVSYPASNPDTIAVGASHDGLGNLEQRSAYSQFGPEVDVVAPSNGGASGITTTDRTGSVGYASGNYTSDFGGTSSATPLVAGIVANIITHAPTLTAAEIRDILHQGTDPIGPYAYPGGRNDYYGYGRVNLEKALQAATTNPTLSVTKSGSGNGQVTSSPPGIDCGTDCEEAYNQGTSVTLTATPVSGSTFTGWSGGGCSGTGSCTVTMNNDLTVTATFLLVQRTLTINKSGTGSGTVTSSPPGINCGTDCTEDYTAGTSVLLTATPASGSVFVDWTNCPAPSGSTCTVLMDQDRQVNARFYFDIAPIIGVAPASLEASQATDTQTTQVLTISNTGDADLDWNLAETETTCSSPGDIPWVSTSPASGTTPPSGSSTVNVVFDSTGLAMGNYAGTLCINSNDPTTPLVEVPVSLQVTGSGIRANDVVIDFGSQYGIWAWMNNDSWADSNELSPISMVIGDIDDSGQDDIIIDFGSPDGIWIWLNNSTWVKLHSLSANSMTTGDIDGNGLAEVIIDFGTGIGIWVWMNNSTWVKLHSLSANSMTTGDMDGSGQDDIIIDFGSPDGIWIWRNNSTWVKLHCSISGEGMVTGNLDGLPSVSNTDITTQEGPAELDNAEPLPEAEPMSLPTE